MSLTIESIIQSNKRTPMGSRSLKYCEDLMDLYLEKGGHVTTIEDGTLGLGKVLCYGEGMKTAVITEYFSTAWSSGHTVRMYNSTPKKYLKYVL